MLRSVEDWLDERIGWRARRQARVDAAVAGTAPLSSAIGASVAACFVVLVLTGIVLMTVYAPSPQTAWASVHYLQYSLPGGWIVRGLHSWAAQAMIGLSVLHVVQSALVGGHRRPREIVWWLTLVIVGLAVGAGITGGLLPWDQRGWWARVVEGNIIGLAPAIGGWLQRMMTGGAELGALGLARAHAMHVTLLPLATAGALWCRHALVRRQGWTGNAAVGGPRAGPALDAAVTVIIVVIALTACTWKAHGAPLDAPADPMSDYPARPEWFLLTLYELRKFFHGSGEFWGTSLVPGAAALYLIALPWVDAAPRQGRGRQRMAGASVLLIVAAAFGLGVLAWHKDARDPLFLRQRARADARAATAAQVAMDGIPPAGALEMVRRDPELRGRDLFERQCASCHVLGDLGDSKKATATKLDGWGTAAWIAAMTHDPDAPEFFGRGPYKGEMPSVDVRPKDKPPGEKWSPMVKSDAERHAVALFLESLGDEPGDPPRAADDAARALGKKIVTERCTSCHLFSGDGDDEGTGLAPELSGYGSLAWTRAQIANPATPQTYREGALDEKKKKHMPRFDGELRSEDIDIVARWTRAHARGLPLR
jgi:ubiquinol-cytochrome c reductase cytochrome b subunit